MTFLNIIGGIALILFGIRFLRKGLERLFGHQLYERIERTARRPWQAAIAGLVFGTFAPSSTAQTLFSLQLLRTGKLSTQSVLGFLLGANLGITVTVQLIALRIFDYYALFLVVGFVCFQWFRSENIRGVGQSTLGLGFVFLAMNIMSRAATIAAANPDFTTVLGVLVNHRLLVILFIAAMTLAIQSSTAVIGLALALADAGAAHLDLVIPVVLGTNLGVGFTSLLVGSSTWEGRRLAAANLILKSAGIALILLVFPLVAGWVTAMPGGIARQGANFHTGFNLVVTIIGVLFATPLGRLMDRTVKPSSAPAGVRHPPTHLDPAALQTPVFALANATRETLRLADAVKAMLEGGWQAMSARDASLASAVQKQDDRVDELNANIKAYLSQIPAQGLTPADRQLQFGLLNFSSQLEAIGDVIDKSLCGATREHAHENTPRHPEDQSALEELYRKVMHRFDAAISVLATRDRTLARQFLHEGDALKEWAIEVQKRHYARISPGDPGAITASTRFLDTFNVLRRISGQLNTIGHTFLLE